MHTQAGRKDWCACGEKVCAGGEGRQADVRQVGTLRNDCESASILLPCSSSLLQGLTGVLWQSRPHRLLQLKAPAGVHNLHRLYNPKATFP